MIRNMMYLFILSAALANTASAMLAQLAHIERTAIRSVRFWPHVHSEKLPAQQFISRQLSTIGKTDSKDSYSYGNDIKFGGLISGAVVISGTGIYFMANTHDSLTTSETDSTSSCVDEKTSTALSHLTLAQTRIHEKWLMVWEYLNSASKGDEPPLGE